MADETPVTKQLPAPKVGDQVLYSPDLIFSIAAYQGEVGGHFHWHHVIPKNAQTAPVYGPPNDQIRYRHDDRVERKGQLGQVKERDPATGTLLTHGGHVIRPGAPIRFWEAEILALNPDGSADLKVYDPNGHAHYEMPDRSDRIVDGVVVLKGTEIPGTKHDANKAPHTWHIPGE